MEHLDRARGLDARGVGVDLDVLPPAVPKTHRMIIEGTGDRITFPDHVRALAAHEGEPRVHWFPGSHLAQVGRRAAFTDLIQFTSRAST